MYICSIPCIDIECNVYIIYDNIHIYIHIHIYIYIYIYMYIICIYVSRHMCNIHMTCMTCNTHIFIFFLSYHTEYQQHSHTWRRREVLHWTGPLKPWRHHGVNRLLWEPHTRESLGRRVTKHVG